jgi:hypothetical protein
MINSGLTVQIVVSVTCGVVHTFATTSKMEAVSSSVSVPCRRFTACKKSLNATWKSGISGKIYRPFLAHTVPPLATRISRKTTSGESWNF